MNLQIRGHGLEVPAELAAYAERRLRFALGGFDLQLRALRVALTPVESVVRAGLNRRCRIEATLRGGDLLVAEVDDAELEPAIARAADRLARRIRDLLERQRLMAPPDRGEHVA